MSKWLKVPCTLKFTLHGVDLHTEIDSRFRLSWSRGSASGQTDVVAPERDHLTFNASYECTCKMYINKHDKSVRPKKVKMVLHRFQKEREEKVYGKLTVDVGEYYGITTISKFDRDMESGRGKAPTLHASFVMFPVGQEVAATATDMNDVSFVGDQDKRMPLSDWDVTEVESDSAEGEEKEKKRKKHHKESDGKKRKKHHKDSVEEPVKEEEKQKKRHHSKGGEGKEKKRHRTEKQVEEGDEAAQEPTSEQAEVELKESAPLEDEEESRREIETETMAKRELEELDRNEEAREQHGESEERDEEGPTNHKEEQEEGEYSESSSREAKTAEDEDATKEQQSRERQAEEQLMNASVEYFMHVVLSHEWPAMRSPPQLMSGVLYPPMVFPVFAAILHSKILTSSEDVDFHFDSTMAVMTAELPTITATAQDRFLTTMALIFLVRKNSALYKFDTRKSEALLTELMRILEQQVMTVIQPALVRADLLVNRFSTASFEFDHLLLDFRDVMKMTKSSFKYGETLDKMLMARFLELFENRLINKLIENPLRFNFTNSMVWNSFLTAFESDERISLQLLRHLISGLIMAPNIATQPNLVKEVCPHIPTVIVAFILKNYQKDANVPQPVEPALFLKMFKIKVVPDCLEPIQPTPNTEIVRLEQSARLQDWNRCSSDEECLGHYAFLREFVA